MPFHASAGVPNPYDTHDDGSGRYAEQSLLLGNALQQLLGVRASPKGEYADDAVPDARRE